LPAPGRHCGVFVFQVSSLLFFSVKRKEAKENQLLPGWMGGKLVFLFCCGFWCGEIWQYIVVGSSFLLCQKKRSKRKSFEEGLGAQRAPAGAGVIRSFLFRQKGTEKPERHARFGKSPHSPIFGAAAHDHVMLAVIETGHGRRALPRPETGLRDLPALRYVAGLRLPGLGCGEGMIVTRLRKEMYLSRKREAPEGLQPRTSLEALLGSHNPAPRTLITKNQPLPYGKSRSKTKSAKPAVHAKHLARYKGRIVPGKPEHRPGHVLRGAKAA